MPDQRGVRAHSPQSDHAERSDTAGEDLLRALVECAPDAIVVVDADGRIVLANGQTERLFAYDREELLGQPVEILLPPRLRARHVGHRKNYDADPRNRTMGAELNLWGLRKDGTEFPAEISLSPCQTEKGTFVTTVIRDVTERQRLEEERAKTLRQQTVRAEADKSQARSQLLAEVSSILSSSLDYAVTLGAVARLCASSFADWCLFHVVDDSGVIEQRAIAHRDPPLERALADQTAWRTLDWGVEHPVVAALSTREARVMRRLDENDIQAFARGGHPLDSAIAPQSVIVLPLVARDKVLGAVTFVLSDPDRRFDDHDLAFATDLSRRVATAIDNAKLYWEAQEANRLKDEFLATLSHELRTPLNAILGWTQLLKGRGVPEEIRGRAASIIERNAQLQAQIVADILDVSRIVSGKLRLELSDVELVPLVDGVLEGLQPAADAKGVSLEKRLDAEVHPISGDSARLQQVIWNLLSNAIKFTPAGGHIEVRLAQRGPQVEIVVTDSGVGIPPDFLPYLFDRFRQADPSTTRSHSGLGLGLAIVRHIVDLHGGNVIAESRGPDLGATFTVTLPSRPPSRTSRRLRRRTAATAFPEAAVDASALRGRRLLVVDDEPDARELLQTALQRWGAAVTVAASAAEALRAIAQEVPDAIIADIAMPLEDGYSLIRAIRLLPGQRGGHVPAIALTAYASESDQAEALRAGFSAHLAKPVDQLALVSTIGQLLAARSS